MIQNPPAQRNSFSPHSIPGTPDNAHCIRLTYIPSGNRKSSGNQVQQSVLTFVNSVARLFLQLTGNVRNLSMPMLSALLHSINYEKKIKDVPIFLYTKLTDF